MLTEISQIKYLVTYRGGKMDLTNFKIEMRDWFRLEETDELTDLTIENIYKNITSNLLNTIINDEKMQMFKHLISKHYTVDLSTVGVVDIVAYPVPKITLGTDFILGMVGNPVHTTVAKIPTNMSPVVSIVELMTVSMKDLVSKYIMNDGLSMLINDNTLGSVGKITYHAIKQDDAIIIIQSNKVFDNFISENGKNQITEYITKYNRGQA